MDLVRLIHGLLLYPSSYKTSADATLKKAKAAKATGKKGSGKKGKLIAVSWKGGAGPLLPSGPYTPRPPWGVCSNCGEYFGPKDTHVLWRWRVTKYCF